MAPADTNSGADRAIGTNGHTRRAELLSIAADLFFERGFMATTMAEIAQRVGVLKGSLYHYISSKEELLYLVVSEAYRGYESRLLEYERSPDPGADRVARFVRDHVRTSIENRVSIGVFNREFRHLDGAFREEVLEIRSRHDRSLRSLIADGIADGSIDPGVEPFLYAMALMGILNAIPTWYRPEGRLTESAIAEVYRELARRMVTSGSVRVDAAPMQDRPALDT